MVVNNLCEVTNFANLTREFNRSYWEQILRRWKVYIHEIPIQSNTNMTTSGQMTEWLLNSSLTENCNPTQEQQQHQVSFQDSRSNSGRIG